jgi:hypothetical protein
LGIFGLGISGWAEEKETVKTWNARRWSGGGWQDKYSDGQRQIGMRLGGDSKRESEWEREKEREGEEVVEKERGNPSRRQWRRRERERGSRRYLLASLEPRAQLTLSQAWRKPMRSLDERCERWRGCECSLTLKDMLGFNNMGISMRAMVMGCVSLSLMDLFVCLGWLLPALGEKEKSDPVVW